MSEVAHVQLYIPRALDLRSSVLLETSTGGLAAAYAGLLGVWHSIDV